MSITVLDSGEKIEDESQYEELELDKRFITEIEGLTEITGICKNLVLALDRKQKFRRECLMRDFLKNYCLD